MKKHICLLSTLLLISLNINQTLHLESDPEVPDVSEGSDYEEEEEQERDILTDVKDLEGALQMFPQTFVYITKDNCEYCKSLDPVFEEVFRILQKDQNCTFFFLIF